jgi:hypothetical protein
MIMIFRTSSFSQQPGHTDPALFYETAIHSTPLLFLVLFTILIYTTTLPSFLASFLLYLGLTVYLLHPPLF